MKIVAWNVRGMNHPLKQREVVSRIGRLKANLVCLFETRVKEPNVKKIIERWFSDCNYIHNYSYTINGRIWMLWKEEIQVTYIDSFDQNITVCIQYDVYKFYLS